jgi:hypothetical protein
VVLDHQREKLRIRTRGKLLAVAYFSALLGGLAWAALPLLAYLDRVQTSWVSALAVLPDDPLRGVVLLLTEAGIGLSVLALMGVMGILLWWPMCRVIGLRFADSWLIGVEMVMVMMFVCGIVFLLGGLGSPW